MDNSSNRTSAGTNHSSLHLHEPTVPEKEGNETCHKVQTADQLAEAPSCYKANDGNTNRPLQYCDTNGNVYRYALNPLWYSALFILGVELLERFCYNGLMFSATASLTGIYDPSWNANLTAVQASTFVSTATAITYASPLLGGIIADAWLGDYWEILLGASILYIPGLLLIALASYPGLLGTSYNTNALIAGMLGLWPLGAGAMKSVVNVFGAKQFHPVLQSGMMENFYVYYYMLLNIGALLGGVLVPLVAQANVAAAYTLPVCAFSFGLLVFSSFRDRYVHTKSEKDHVLKVLKLISKRTQPCQSFEAAKKSNDGQSGDKLVEDVKRLLMVIPISSMIIPFAIVYFQLATVFVIQGTAMQPAGWIDASMMNNLDAISVIVFGYLASAHLYPFLKTRFGITLATTTKFSIGTGFAAASILGLIIVDREIQRNYDSSNGASISILWQTFSYVLVGAAKIFCFSAAYEVTFKVAPANLKGLASSLMIVTSGAVPNVLSVALYNAFETWFPVGTTLQDYVNAVHFDDYLWVVLGITCSASILLALPPVRKWVEGIKMKAAELDNSNHEVSSDSSIEEV